MIVRDGGSIVPETKDYDEDQDIKLFFKELDIFYVKSIYRRVSILAYEHSLFDKHVSMLLPILTHGRQCKGHFKFV